MVVAMLDYPSFGARDLSSLRALIGGGSPVLPELVRRVEFALGVPFSIVLGQTEAAPCMTQTRLDDTPADRAHTFG